MLNRQVLFLEISPERDLEGDLHLGVVHLLDVSQVQLAIHIQRVTLGLQVLLRRFDFVIKTFPFQKIKSEVLLTW